MELGRRGKGMKEGRKKGEKGGSEDGREEEMSQWSINTLLHREGRRGERREEERGKKEQRGGGMYGVSMEGRKGGRKVTSQAGL